MSLHDENAEILDRMAKNGSDLSAPRVIDFCHIFAHRQAAETFASFAARLGFSAKIEEVRKVDREEYPWDVIFSKEMVPSVENITATEEGLDGLARTHGGRADGWGFFRT
jgi:regulator of RNase E activity RraB